jgi:hypothetical protein
MAMTNQQLADQASDRLTLVTLAQLQDEDDNGFGFLLASLCGPVLAVRSGLPSQAAHEESNPGAVLGVTDEGLAANLTIIYAGAPAATEVLVQYGLGAEVGVPTLTFNAAVTGYGIVQLAAPKGSPEMWAAVGA